MRPDAVPHPDTDALPVREGVGESDALPVEDDAAVRE